MTQPTSPTADRSALLASPTAFLMVLAFVNWFGFASWSALINNFAKEAASFSGQDIGILQSVREIPGFLAFTAIILFWFMREQILAYFSLVALGIGIAITGYFPTLGGLLLTTTIMSLGFHYYETAQQSLQLQLLPKAQAPRLLGRIAGASAMAQLLAFGGIALVWKLWQPGYTSVFLVTGLATAAMTLVAWAVFPRFQGTVPQNKGFVLRQRYWLYYALTFMGGARRQIFTVFAGFLMVERFGYDVHEVAALFLVNGAVNMLLAPKIGAWIGKVGEKTALTVEYIGLIGVFATYAFVTNAYLAGALYVIDHAFFAIAIAMKTYFQKIADPADIAPTAGVAFTINHIAAVFIPALFGLVWLISPAAVFLTGAAMACVSLTLSRLVPDAPREGNEVVFFWRKPVAAAAE